MPQRQMARREPDQFDPRLSFVLDCEFEGGFRICHRLKNFATASVRVLTWSFS